MCICVGVQIWKAHIEVLYLSMILLSSSVFLFFRGLNTFTPFEMGDVVLFHPLHLFGRTIFYLKNI